MLHAVLHWLLFLYFLICISVLLVINHKNVYTIVLFSRYIYIYISQESKPLCRIELRGVACRLRSVATQRQSTPATLWFRSADAVDVGTGLAGWHQGQRHKGDSRPQGAQCRQKNARYSTPKSWWYWDILMIWYRMFSFARKCGKKFVFFGSFMKAVDGVEDWHRLCFTSVP